MTFSNQWQSIYEAGMQHAAWPWSDLVSLVFRHIGGSKLAGRRVLELGCGTGPNAAFFVAQGADYCATEGSEAAVAVVHKRFPQLSRSVVVGDFTRAFPSAGPYDLIVDRASVTHNSLAAITETLARARASLVPGGFYIGVDWFSEHHSDRQFGTLAEDTWTLTDFSDGQFRGVGRVHFASEAHMRELFADFELVFLAEKTTRYLHPATGRQVATFDVVAKTPTA